LNTIFIIIQFIIIALVLDIKTTKLLLKTILFYKIEIAAFANIHPKAIQKALLISEKN